MAAKRNSLKKSLVKTIDTWAKNISDDQTKVVKTTFICAFRDALTDMMHIAKERGFDFQPRLEAAKEVFIEECED